MRHAKAKDEVSNVGDSKHADDLLVHHPETGEFYITHSVSFGDFSRSITQTLGRMLNKVLSYVSEASVMTRGLTA